MSELLAAIWTQVAITAKAWIAGIGASIAAAIPIVADGTANLIAGIVAAVLTAFVTWLVPNAER